jgi:hypothetical protein
MPAHIASSSRALINLTELTNRAFQSTGAAVHVELDDDLADLKATITSAAIDKRCGELGPHTRDAIDILINMATGNGTMGADAQEVLREIYADPNCADIRADLQQAALSMCKFAHRAADPDGGALSVTVAYLGAFALGPHGEGDLGNFLNNYLNKRTGKDTPPAPFNPRQTVPLSKFIGLGQTQRHVQVCEKAISLDMDPDVIASEICDHMLSAVHAGKPAALWVTDTSLDTSNSLILMLEPTQSGCKLHLINTAEGTPEGSRMQSKLERIADEQEIELDIHTASNSFSAYLNHRILRSLNTKAGEIVGPKQEDWLGEAIEHELATLSGKSVPQKVAETVAGQAEILEDIAALRDGIPKNSPDDILRDAKHDHPAPAAPARDAMGRAGDGSVARTQYGRAGPEAYGRMSPAGPMHWAGGQVPAPDPVRPFVPAAQVAALENLTDLDAQLGIEKGPTVNGFASPFSKPSPWHSAFYRGRDSFAAKLNEPKFSAFREKDAAKRSSPLYKTVQTVASQHAISELTAGPARFLTECNKLAEAAKGATPSVRIKIENALQKEAQAFIGNQDKQRMAAAAAIEELADRAALGGADAADARDLRDALASFNYHCIFSDLVRSVSVFAEHVWDCPAAAIDFFQPPSA